MVESVELPRARSVLAICAHPDDESFGLGAILAAFAESGSSTSVLCFTRGEASTLGADTPELGRVRTDELTNAAGELGVLDAQLLHYPDGALSDVPLDELSSHVRVAAERSGADLLLVFDEGGITGHPDHCRATDAAVVIGRELNLGTLAWSLSEQVATTLELQFGVGFVGRDEAQVDMVVTVDRARQHKAIARHVSQLNDNPVLGRRLALQGDQESLRWLVRTR